MKPVLVVPTLLGALWVEFPDVIVASAEWLAEKGGAQATPFADHPIIETEDTEWPLTGPRPTGFDNKPGTPN